VYTPTLGELVGDELCFFKEYFSRKPLLRRNEATHNPRDILSSADLDDLLHQQYMRLPYVRVIRGGTYAPDKSYVRTVRLQDRLIPDCVAPERVYEHFQSGATIQFNSVNHFLPNLRGLADMFAEKFRVPCDIISFLSPAGGQGTGVHHDPTDLVVIQLEGTKAWKLWGRPQTRGPSHASFAPGQLGNPALEFTLAPGDVLYMPYNTPHLATSCNEMSLHLSVTVRPRTWGELLIGLVHELMANDPGFAEIPRLSEDSLDEQALGLKQRIGTLAGHLALVEPEKLVRTLMDAGRTTEGARPPEGLFRATARIEKADETTDFIRSPLDVVVRETADGTATIAVKPPLRAASPVTVKVPEEVAATLLRLRCGEKVRPRQLLPGGAADEVTETAKILARHGILRLAS
jgi:hypothetical protein